MVPCPKVSVSELRRRDPREPGHIGDVLRIAHPEELLIGWPLSSEVNGLHITCHAAYDQDHDDYNDCDELAPGAGTFSDPLQHGLPSLRTSLLTAANVHPVDWFPL